MVFRPLVASLRQTYWDSLSKNLPSRSKHLVQQLRQGQIDPQTLEVAGMWPEPARLAAPDYVPTAVARAFIQAEDNRRRFNLEAAGVMYRR